MSRGYRTLLRILPRAFRDEFTEEMVATFAAQRSRAHGGDVVGLWLSTILEIVALSARLRFDQCRTDLRHTLRSLWRQKTFTLTAVATLALAFGPATAVFSLVRHAVFDPVPGATLDGVVAVRPINATRAITSLRWSELNFLDHRARRRGLSALAAFTETSATFGGDAPQQVIGTWVSPDIFPVLGVAPARGRGFEDADTLPGSEPTIILGHEFARARFGTDDVIGRELDVDGRRTTVIGVLPPGLQFPGGDSQFWQPLVIDRSSSARGMSYLEVLGRLDGGATLAEVERQMNLTAADLEHTYPSTNAGYRVALSPASQSINESARRVISVMGLAAMAIFLLACTNITSLTLVRVAARQPELAVRAALGASRARLSRQLLVEHVVIAAVAAVAALAVSTALLRLLAITQLIPVYQVERSSIDGAALLFLGVLTASTSIVLGGLVSRRAARGAGVTTGARTQSSSREVVRWRQALVSLEIGAAVVLLVAAALLLQSAARLNAVDTGFRSDRVTIFQVSLPMSRYNALDARVRFVDGVLERLKALPGVEAAASAGYAPMTGTRATRRFAVDGKPLPAAGSEPLAIDLPADPGYASMMQLRVIDGRWIDERDRADSPPVVVISETLARQFFPGERAIGHRLRYYSGRPDAPPPPMPEIVGVVSDVRQFAAEERPASQIYSPHAQRPWTLTSFFIRTTGDARTVISSLPAAVHAVDPDRPLENLHTLDELVDADTADRRALSALLTIAAGVALLISTIGVYGVTAATTAARRRELAIRAAIGADRSTLIALVVRQCLIAAAVGVVAGLIVATTASSVLESVLFDVKARDPWTFATVGLGLLAACAIATYLPARRAVSDSPAVTLKEPA